MIDTMIYWLGAVVATLLVALFAWLVTHIVGNIYGGFIGAIRYRRLRLEHLSNRPLVPMRWVFRQALSCWAGGNRYDGNVGVYWQLGPLQIPVDGRSPIPPEKFYG